MEEKTYKQSGKTLTSEWQKQVYAYVSTCGEEGLTDLELQEITGKGHGSTSSALSTLHKNGYIERLREKRLKSSVYVLPRYVGEREILPPMTNTGQVTADVELQRENRDLKKKLSKIEKLVAPQWRSPSYRRDDLIDDIRRILL